MVTTQATLRSDGPWRGWARPRGESRWQLLVAGFASETEADRELIRLTAHWRHKDTYLTPSGRDPNVKLL